MSDNLYDAVVVAFWLLMFLLLCALTWGTRTGRLMWVG